MTTAGPADFQRTTFASRAAFNGATFSHRALFNRAVFFDRAFFDECTFSGLTTFEAAKFKERVSFNNCSFERSSRFYQTSFAEAPEFHGATLHQDTTFTDAEFGRLEKQDDELRMSWDTRARTFRTLAQAMNKVHAHEEEHRFFGLEMAAKAHLVPSGRRLLIVTYGMISDFGRSVWRPSLAILILFISFFAMNWTLSHPVDICDGMPPNRICEFEKWEAQLAVFTAAASLPVVGQSSYSSQVVQLLFAPNVQPIIYFGTLVQGALSALLLFLIGLALRNQFRLK
jgi:hypothetical protein